MNIAGIFRILNANLILALPFIIGINCNLAVDCRAEKRKQRIEERD